MEATKKIAGQSRHARKKHRVDRISAGAMPPNGRALHVKTKSGYWRRLAVT